jgi:PAS domain S-box-containing protein
MPSTKVPHGGRPVRPVQSKKLPRLASPVQPEDEIDAFYDSVPIGLAVLDTDARYLRINKRLARLNGHPAEAHIGRTVRDILPAFADEVESLIRKIVTTGRPVLNCEFVGETPARPGVRRYWVEHWYPLRNADGVVAAINVLVEEVTERKRQEQALQKAHADMEQKVRARTADLTAVVAALKREAEERTRAQSLLKLQRDLAIALTFPGSLIETLDRILDAACEVDGIDCGGIYTVDAESQTVDLACHRGLSAAFVRSAARYTHKERPAQQLHDGRTLYLSRTDIERPGLGHLRREGMRAAVVVPVKHAGRVVAALNLASHTEDSLSEITRNAIESIAAQIGPAIARVKAEAALHLNEQNLQALFDSLGDFLFIVDDKGAISHVNPTVAHRLEYSAAELRGKPGVFVHPPAQRKRATVVLAAMLGGKATSCDIPLMAKSGTLIPVETRVVRGEWNGKKALFGISRDISDRKRAEQELLDRQHQLRALVAELAVAEENERRRIAHGLHDDISQMLARAKLTLGHVAALVQEEKARDMVGDVSGYLDHVLQVSRSLTFDLASPVLQRFGLEAAVEDLCDKMTAQHGFPFVVRNDGTPKPLAGATEIVVFHAVRELLRNIVSHAGAHRVVVSLSRVGAQLRVVVQDDGVGFDRTSIGDVSRKGGFGLYAIQERMKHLGGAFASKGVFPHGTRIVLTIPLSPAQESAEPRTRQPKSRTSARRID